MSKEIHLIALGAEKMVGKDTFFNVLDTKYRGRFYRLAFADKLKEILEPVCFSLFRKKICELTPEQKEIFRPIMIETGRAARALDINFWVKMVDDEIINRQDDKLIPVITDMRYPSEYHYFKEIYGDSMIFINIQRDGAPDPTDEEKKNAPELKKFANFMIDWPTVGDNVDELMPYVSKFYNKYFN